MITQSAPQTPTPSENKSAPLRLVSIGECMVELSPSAQAGEYKMGFAGDTFNTAWYVKSLSAESHVRYVSRVGTDAASDNMLAMMQTAGIDTQHIARSPDRSVGLYLISLMNGERSFSYWRDTSAARQLGDDELALKTAIGDGDIVYFSGITLAILDPHGRDTLLRVMADARTAGKTIVFDSNLRPRLWASSQDMTTTVMRAAQVSDIILPSFDDEAVHFGDADCAATRDRYLAAGARSVIVKNGEGIVEYVHHGDSGSVQPPLAQTVADTTSAGDSFNAGFLVGLHQNLPIKECILLGARLATHVIGQKGALVDLPSDFLTVG